LTRKQAFEEELKIHKINNAVNDTNFINKLFATINGCFGAFGELAWNFDLTKETCESITKQAETLSSRNKHNCEYLRIIAEKMKTSRLGQNNPSFGKTKENSEIVRLANIKRSATLTKLLEVVRKELVIKKNYGEMLKQIHSWIIALGYNVSINSISGIYKRNKHLIQE
jgi:hypothetical protein